MILIFIAIILAAAAIVIQKNHYDFLNAQKEQKNLSVLSDELQVRLKEFDDIKKRVDALVIRSGFKL